MIIVCSDNEYKTPRNTWRHSGKDEEEEEKKFLSQNATILSFYIRNQDEENEFFPLTSTLLRHVTGNIPNKLVFFIGDNIMKNTKGGLKSYHKNVILLSMHFA